MCVRLFRSDVSHEGHVITIHNGRRDGLALELRPRLLIWQFAPMVHGLGFSFAGVGFRPQAAGHQVFRILSIHFRGLTSETSQIRAVHWLLVTTFVYRC